MDSSLRRFHLRSRFRDLFRSQSEAQICAAPGRINLIGEHTDYNDGWVLPMAIDRHVWIAFAPRPDKVVRAHSVVFVETHEARLDDLEKERGSHWFSYVAGLVWTVMQAGYDVSGMDIVIDADLPPGSGLSSSAALEMATARALCEVSLIPWRPREMARFGQQTENEFIGVASGLMDQLVSAVALEDCALLLDCRELDTQDIPLPRDAAFVVMDTGASRTLVGSEYNDRRQSCDRAVQILQRTDPSIQALRDVDRETLRAHRAEMDETTYRRATHVVEENQRPGAMAVALQSWDLETAGRLMSDSHASLRDLYEVSSHELNLITELARQHPACHGARLTGAGFGGSAIALVAAEETESFIEETHAAYRSRVDLPSQLFACRPAAGVRLLEND